MDGPESKSDRSRDLQTLEGEDKKRQRSSKPRESGWNVEGEESDGIERRRSSTKDRDDSRKRTGGTRRADYDDDYYEARKESRSKQTTNKQDDISTLDNLSSWYGDREYENKRDGSYIRKSTSKFSDKGMDDGVSRVRDRDIFYLEKDEINQDKGRSHGKRREDTDAVKNVGEVNYMGNLDSRRRKFTDTKPESVGAASMPEHEDGLGSPGDRGMKSRDSVGEKIDSENRTSREKMEVPEEDTKRFSPFLEERAGKVLIEQQRSSVNCDDVETRQRSFNSSDDRSRREPEQHEIANIEMEPERSIVSKRKEPEKEGYREERSRGRDHDREWEVGYRHSRDNERPQGRYGRRDMAMKSSSAYGVSDVIEIQTKPFEIRSEPPQQSETKPGPIVGGFSGDDSNNLRNSDETDFQDGKMKGQRNNSMLSRNVSGVEPGSPFNRGASPGSRGGRGGRGRPAGRDRDSQQPYGVPMPMMGSPFGPMGMGPPGPMQTLNPNMSPSPFMPTFPPPLVWPGLAVPPNLSPVPPRFPSNLGNPPNPAMFFNQTGLGRGDLSNMSSPGVNAMVPFGRGQNQEKGSGYDFPVKTMRPPGKAPSRGEQNDYSQNFVDTGMRPQNYIRELELTAVVEDYPRLRELIQKKDEIVTNSNTAPMYYKCDLREHVLTPEFFGTKFDVILVDPPWEEYVHRAPGVTDHMEYWTFEEIMNLKIEAIADTPSFIFLWVGDGVGLEQGRQCLKKWGFRRCEDICWVKTNKTNATPGLRHDSHTLFQRSKEHCLMGIKGTVRRSTDGHVIHANIDTDVIIAEEPPYGSTAKPEDMYRIVEHFALGRRRLELFGEDHNIRSGWLTVGKGLSSSNFNTEGYVRNFADKDGKVWQGGGGRNPPPEAPHLVVTTPDIEALRPKSPMKNQMQLQQQSNSISVTTVQSTPNRMPTFNQDASGSSFSTPGPWATMDPFKGGNIGNDDRTFDTHGYNMNSGQSY